MRRLDIGEYHRIIEAGILDEGERVQLLEGVIVAMSPQNPAHALVVERLSNPRFVRLPPDFAIRCQLPLALSDADEPEPDIAVIRSSTPRSREHHPSTAQLVIEVAGASLHLDREVKAQLYARAGITEYVIVNLRDECLEVHRDADSVAGRYRVATKLHEGDEFSSTSVPGFGFEVADLLA
jgi:Uma2 family endonuclease